jgi:hypothetical protein
MSTGIFFYLTCITPLLRSMLVPPMYVYCSESRITLITFLNLKPNVLMVLKTLNVTVGIPLLMLCDLPHLEENRRCMVCFFFPLDYWDVNVRKTILTFIPVATHNFIHSQNSNPKKETINVDLSLDRNVLVLDCSNIIHISVFDS